MSSISITPKLITAACILSRVLGSEQSCKSQSQTEENPMMRSVSNRRRLMFKNLFHKSEPEMPEWTQWSVPVEFVIKEADFIKESLESPYTHQMIFKSFIKQANAKISVAGEEQPLCSVGMKKKKKLIRMNFPGKSIEYKKGEHIPIRIQHGTVMRQRVVMQINLAKADAKPKFQYSTPTCHWKLKKFVQKSRKDKIVTELTLKTDDGSNTYTIDNMQEFSNDPDIPVSASRKKLRGNRSCCWYDGVDNSVLTLYSMIHSKKGGSKVNMTFEAFVLHLNDPEVNKCVSKMMGGMVRGDPESFLKKWKPELLK